MACNHHHAANDFSYLEAFGDYGIIIGMLITGLIGSFTHCVFMCGPIAIALSNTRMIECSDRKMSEFDRIKLALLVPYYLGKASTYTIFALAMYLLKIRLSEVLIFKYIAFPILVFVSIMFILFAFNFSNAFHSIKIPKFLQSRFNKISFNTTYGLKGFFQGMILGLIPCGFVIASITLAVAYSVDLPILITSVFLFGFATVPGLFLASYFGVFITKKLDTKFFKMLYILVMVINSILILRYALKLF
jgi:uncharacterized protein